jgi:hypothetical protein
MHDWESFVPEYEYWIVILNQVILKNFFTHGSRGSLFCILKVFFKIKKIIFLI